MSSKTKLCEPFCLKLNFLRKLHIKLTFSGCPRKFYHRVMYIAPSSGHISFNCNMPFKLILRRCEVVFWWCTCLEWECCTFWKIDGNSLKSTNKYYMYTCTHVTYYVHLYGFNYYYFLIDLDACNLCSIIKWIKWKRHCSCSCIIPTLLFKFSL